MSQLDVSIMGQAYRLSCRDEEEGKLRQAVAYVDGKMRAIRDAGRIRGTDRIAVMVCLSMAAELLTLKSPDAPLSEAALTELRQKVDAMTRIIDSAFQS
ncbi:MAG: cell division protein ZapA [Oxalobacter sp.]|nr:cell division protein ZapA [Oxalobacter sp.]